MWELIIKVSSVLGGLLLMVAYVPQIIALYKEKTVEGISIIFWLVLDSALLMLLIMAVDGYMVTGSAYLLTIQAINLLLALIVTGQVVYYGGKNDG